MSDVGKYVYVGNACGRFEDKQGKMVNYCHIFANSPVSNYVSEDYKAEGMKAEKFKCVSPDVWKNIELGTTVQLFFNSRNQVAVLALDE